MGYKTLQNIDEAARALLTHRCRYRPGLKLRPEHCDKYRESKANPMVVGGSDALLCNQWQCPGPVEISTVTLTHGTEPVLVEKSAKTYDSPSTCRTCGLLVDSKREDGSVVHFYPSRPDECIQCILEKRKAREMVVTEAKGRRDAEAPKFKFRCERHGPHNGKLFGRDRMSSVCPKCNSEKVAATMRLKHLKASESSINLPLWLVAWANEKARENNTSPAEYIALKMLEGVDANWFKAFVMKEGFGGLESGKDHNAQK